jgi:AraC family transcriptional regulator
MIRHDFPDLTWLRNQVALRFKDKQGWPNVVLNVKSSGCYRPDITGPLSIFINIKGQSRCGVVQHTVTIPETHYFITNPGENYTLQIPENSSTETFNIHVGERFLEQVYDGLLLPADCLLENPFELQRAPIHFFNRLYPKDAVFNALLNQIYQQGQAGITDALLLEEQLAGILVYLLQVHRSVLKEVEKLPATKRATQLEIYKRLCYSVDYLEANYSREITLDELAQVACLSKFHYLRSFRACFRQTPHQYLTAIRLEKAKALLKYSHLQVTDIALAIGLQHVGSLSRLFSQKVSASAGQYRLRQAGRN